MLQGSRPNHTKSCEMHLLVEIFATPLIPRLHHRSGSVTKKHYVYLWAKYQAKDGDFRSTSLV